MIIWFFIVFFSDLGFFFSLIKRFFHVDLSLPLFFRVFVIDLLQRVLSSTCCNVFCRRLSFSWVFVLVVQMAKFDPTESSDQIMFINILQI